jgi:catechol 2,3-dioxygenase
MMFNISAPTAAVLPSPSLAMGRVALTVRDIGRVADFYESAVGLARLRADGETVLLGAGEAPLIELRLDHAALPNNRREAGLFHTALLLPSQAALGAWLRHSIDKRIPVLGASDHAVSEALYLVDPEGNGLELYTDRPATDWHWHDGLVDMPSNALDLMPVLHAANPSPWEGIDPGTRMGHVHLQVGAIAPAEAFYEDVLGLRITSRYSGGTFYAAPGYHHHIATNIWSSRGARPRTPHMAGLAEVEMFRTRGEIEAICDRVTEVRTEGDRALLEDPWGTVIALVPLRAGVSANSALSAPIH